MAIEDEYIKKVDKLIPRPDIALAVMTLANEADCELSRLANLIQQDPSLTANMLRLANSAYFGHMKEIASITDIIVRLGLDSVKLIAISSASAGLLKPPQEAYHLAAGALWNHSYATAILAAAIAKVAKHKAVSTVYTAALLHDIGKMVLNRPLQAESVNQGAAPEPGEMLAFEQKLLHTDHAKVGGYLLQNWGLPKEITVPIAAHHTREGEEAKPLACQIIYLANSLCEEMALDSEDGEYLSNQGRLLLRESGPLPAIPNLAAEAGPVMREFVTAFLESKATLLL